MRRKMTLETVRFGLKLWVRRKRVNYLQVPVLPAFDSVPSKPSLARPQKKNKELGDFNRIMNRSAPVRSAVWQPTGQQHRSKQKQFHMFIYSIILYRLINDKFSVLRIFLYIRENCPDIADHRALQVSIIEKQFKSIN